MTVDTDRYDIARPDEEVPGVVPTHVTRWRGRVIAALLLGVALVPPALIVSAVVRYGWRIPDLDQWSFVQTLLDALDGHLSFASLWALHNEHRILLPRVVLLAIALPTHWDLRYELAACLVCALVLFSLLVTLAWHTMRHIAPHLIPGVVVVTSVFVFSLTQWHNWLWGWQLLMFMTAVGTVLAVLALERWRATWTGLALSLSAAVGAALSFGSGLTMLAVVPVAICLIALIDGQLVRGIRLATVAAVVGLVLAALYVRGFKSAVDVPPMTPFGYPVPFLRYVVAYLGTSLGFFDVRMAIAWGTLGLLAFIASAIWLVLRSAEHRRATLPWIIIGLNAALTGCLNAVGRGGFGTDYALSSRYITVSAMFWIAVGALAFLATAELMRSGSAWVRRVTVAILSSVIALGAVSNWQSWSEARAQVARRHSAMTRATECVMHYEQAPDGCLEIVHPGPAAVRVLSRYLAGRGLGPFPRLTEPKLNRFRLVVPMSPPGHIDAVSVEVVVVPTLTGSYRSRELVVTGWAMDPATRQPAHSVIVTVAGQVVGEEAPRLRRPDVASTLGSAALRDSGWTIRVGTFRLPSGTQHIEAYAVGKDGDTIMRLVNTPAVEIAP